jgi:hypothetical protein
MWLVSYTIILGLCVLSFITSFFQYPDNPIYQISAFISIGKSDLIETAHIRAHTLSHIWPANVLCGC